jgi:hypothetical protein
MKPKTLLIIAAIFVAVVSFYVVLEKVYLPKKEKQEEQQDKVFTLAREDLDLIKIQTERSSIILVKDQESGRWMMTAPAESDVDTGEVESFIASALDTVQNRTLGTKQELADSLADFGLVEPKLTVVLGSGDTSEVLSLGNAVPSGDEVYATRKGDDQVFLVDGFVMEDLNKDSTLLRDKTLVAFSPDDIVSLSVTRDNKTVTVKRQADDSWMITEPMQYPADADQIIDILDFVADGGAVGFAPEGADPAEYGLDRPAITLLLVNRDGATSRLFIGNAAGNDDYWAMREGRPSIFLVSTKVRNKLTVSADFIMNKSLLLDTASDVTAIEVTGADGPISMKRDGRGWKIATPEATAADRNAVNALLSNLREMRLSDIVKNPAGDLALYGLDRPTYTVTLVAGKGDAKHSSLLKLARSAGDTSYGYLSTSMGDFVFSIPTESIESFNPTFDTLKDRSLLSFDPDEITKITVVSGGETYTFRKKGDAWKMTEPKRRKVDTPSIASILTAVGDVSYSEVLADAKDDLKKWGLEEPRTAVTLYGADEAEVGTIAFGPQERRDEKTYAPAVSSSHKEVYGVDADLLDKIKQEIDIIQEGR